MEDAQMQSKICTNSLLVLVGGTPGKSAVDCASFNEMSPIFYFIFESGDYSLFFC